MSPNDVVKALGGDAVAGLSPQDAEQRLRRYGRNEIESDEPHRWIDAVWRQARDPLVVILLVAAGASAALGERIDAAAIAAIVVLNAAVSFFQEWRAEKALAALASLIAPSARVERGGGVHDVPAAEIVPGDIVVLKGGDRVPADLKLIEAVEFAADESPLTGESAPAVKTARADADDAELTERGSLAHAGTIVVSGRGRGVVVAIGAATEFGRIASLAAGVRREPTPLQKRLGRLSRTLGLIALGVGISILVVGVATGRPAFEMFMTAVSLAVAAVPEGLPAVVALSLALGVRAMAKRKALVRRLRAAETLGSATVICTDKTGTLTTGVMTLDRLETAAGAARPPFRAVGVVDEEVVAALQTAAICNDAGFDDAGRAIGAPTEAALLTAARAAGVDAARAASRIAETPFTSDRKMMSVIVAADGGRAEHLKGAPERVIALAGFERRGGQARALDADGRRAWEARASAMAGEGLRVIALAVRSVSASGEAAGDYELLALAGLKDPPRPTARAAVETALRAGVRVIMITGDSADTAAAIARDVGLRGGVVTASDLDDRDSSSWADIAVLARATPEHKLRLIQRLQTAGEVVAMTGDGVNDAPALKKADIGVAMGVRGVDAAKAAADIVLLDDDFSTIVAAMKEGRRQDDNIRRFVLFLLAGNFGEVIAVCAGLVVGGPLILTPPQILWINLITDGATALALGLERAEPDVMDRPPRSPDRSILDTAALRVTLTIGAALGAITVTAFYVSSSAGLLFAQTVAFSLLVAVQQGLVLSFRSFKSPLSRLGWFSNPWLLFAIGAALVLQTAAVYAWPLTTLLGTRPLPWAAVGWIVLAAVPFVVVPEVAKHVRARRR